MLKSCMKSVLRSSHRFSPYPIHKWQSLIILSRFGISASQEYWVGLFTWAIIHRFCNNRHNYAHSQYGDIVLRICTVCRLKMKEKILQIRQSYRSCLKSGCGPAAGNKFFLNVNFIYIYYYCHEHSSKYFLESNLLFCRWARTSLGFKKMVRGLG